MKTMAHLSHKHFNSYKEGLDLEFLRDYCIEHGETRLMKRGEVFEKAGRFVQTNLVFPTSPYTHLLLQSDNGTAKVSNLRVYSLKY